MDNNPVQKLKFTIGQTIYYFDSVRYREVTVTHVSDSHVWIDACASDHFNIRNGSRVGDSETGNRFLPHILPNLGQVPLVRRNESVQIERICNQLARAFGRTPAEYFLSHDTPRLIALGKALDTLRSQANGKGTQHVNKI